MLLQNLDRIDDNLMETEDEILQFIQDLYDENYIKLTKIVSWSDEKFNLDYHFTIQYTENGDKQKIVITEYHRGLDSYDILIDDNGNAMESFPVSVFNWDFVVDSDISLAIDRLALIGRREYEKNKESGTLDKVNFEQYSEENYL